ncbi:hypothetical protein HDU67_002411 [Dinochytrium kinnereticum]|nr:hypothetical protein HDU67_002411 [Dinochytrium kinnereticum]
MNGDVYSDTESSRMDSKSVSPRAGHDAQPSSPHEAGFTLNASSSSQLGSPRSEAERLELDMHSVRNTSTETLNDAEEPTGISSIEGVEPAAPPAAGPTRPLAPKWQYRKTVSQFDIGLDNNRTTFVPGQRIEGHVSLTLTEHTPIRMLRLRFLGKVTTRTSRKEHFLSSASSVNVFFKELQTILGGPTGEDRTILDPGEHVFPFSFRVPLSNLPASFEGSFGNIRYEITATLSRPNISSKTRSTIVTIPSTIDASDAQYQTPFDVKASVQAGYWLWKTGYLNASLSIPKSAYSSEEVVPLTLDIVNHSASGAILKDVYLKQSVLYRTGDEVRGPNVERVHRLTFTESFSPQTRHIRRIINFPIPSTSIFSPTIKTTNLEVTHALVVKVASDQRFAKSQDLEVPITIAGFPSMPEIGHGRLSIDTLPLYYPPLPSSAGSRPSFSLRRNISITHSRPLSGMVLAVNSLQDDDEDDVTGVGRARSLFDEERYPMRSTSASRDPTIRASSIYGRRRQVTEPVPMRRKSSTRTSELTLPTAPTRLFSRSNDAAFEEGQGSSGDSIYHDEDRGNDFLPQKFIDEEVFRPSSPVQTDFLATEVQVSALDSFSVSPILESVPSEDIPRSASAEFSPNSIFSNSATLTGGFASAMDGLSVDLCAKGVLRNKDSAIALDSLGNVLVEGDIVSL